MKKIRVLNYALVGNTKYKIQCSDYYQQYLEHGGYMRAMGDDVVECYYMDKKIYFFKEEGVVYPVAFEPDFPTGKKVCIYCIDNCRQVNECSLIQRLEEIIQEMIND